MSRGERSPRIAAAQTLLHEHRALVAKIDRRRVLRGALSVGGLSLLAGCDVTNAPQVQGVLRAISRWNDRVQAALFDPRRLAPEFPEAMVRKPPRFNAYYPIEQVKPVDPATWKLELAGAIRERGPWTLDALAALPQVTQITRHVCVEGWDYIGQWTGVPLKDFLLRIGADTGARYVAFHCADGYKSSIDMACALHPQTQLTMQYARAPLPDAYGFPLRLRAPTKLGFKLPKWVVAMEVTNVYPGGYWEDRGYNWFSGL
jgi:DMSO/TMAO reductase YedYZ molybdopterin-dependent catalytic subunit